MHTYICKQCNRAFDGPSYPESTKIRPFLLCPGCGCHKARKANEMEERIVHAVMRGAKKTGASSVRRVSGIR